MIYALILGSLAAICALMLGFIALLGKIDPQTAKYLDRENTSFPAKFKNVRWAVIGCPIVMALTMGFVQQSDRQYSDLEEHARLARPFYISGQLRLGTGKRSPTILKYQGGERAIACRPGESAGCARRIQLPADVNAKLFDYRGWWIILELRRADGTLLLDEPSLRKGREWYSREVLQHGFADGALFGFLVGAVLSLFIAGIAAVSAAQARRRLSSP